MEGLFRSFKTQWRPREVYLDVQQGMQDIGDYSDGLLQPGTAL